MSIFLTPFFCFINLLDEMCLIKLLHCIMYCIVFYKSTLILMSRTALPLVKFQHVFYFPGWMSEYGKVNITMEACSCESDFPKSSPRYFHVIAMSLGCKDQSCVSFSLTTAIKSMTYHARCAWVYDPEVRRLSYLFMMKQQSIMGIYFYKSGCTLRALRSRTNYNWWVKR